MQLKHLSLVNYKSFEVADFELASGINGFVGRNGVGKTNVLDAVYHLAYARSYFSSTTIQSIKLGTDFFMIQGDFDDEGKFTSVHISAKKGASRIVKRDGKKYEKLSEHIGLIPVVIISPADRDLITEGSDTRRKFLDSVISIIDAAYLESLITYNRLLQQRNALLKSWASNKIWNSQEMELYDLPMGKLAKDIHLKRKTFLTEFEGFFQKFYDKLSAGAQEDVALEYVSDLDDRPLQEWLKKEQYKDAQLQYTSRGIHKDDIKFRLKGMAIKKYGSQGQQKSFLTALKLAQYEFLKKRYGKSPILLLDDIFDKLDEYRVAELIKMVDEESFGQIFISDTHKDRLTRVIDEASRDYKIFEI